MIQFDEHIFQLGRNHQLLTVSKTLNCVSEVSEKSQNFVGHQVGSLVTESFSLNGPKRESRLVS